MDLMQVENWKEVEVENWKKVVLGHWLEEVEKVKLLGVGAWLKMEVWGRLQEEEEEEHPMVVVGMTVEGEGK